MDSGDELTSIGFALIVMTFAIVGGAVLLSWMFFVELSFAHRVWLAHKFTVQSLSLDEPGGEQQNSALSPTTIGSPAV